MELKEVKKSNPKDIKIKKRRRAKKRAAVFAVFFLLLVFIVLAVLCQTVFFPINDISVTGSRVYSAEEIKENSGIKNGDKLFAVFQSRIEKKLTKALPYIKSVKLKKSLPGSVKLIITETKAVYSMENEGKFWLLDDNYKALEEITENAENIIKISVPTKFKIEAGEIISEDSRELELVKKVKNLLIEGGIEVNSISVSGYDIVNLTVKNRFTVYLGSSENLEGKIAHLGGMLSEIDVKNGENCKGKIDLSAWSETKREGYLEIIN